MAESDERLDRIQAIVKTLIQAWDESCDGYPEGHDDSECHEAWLHKHFGDDGWMVARAINDLSEQVLHRED